MERPTPHDHLHFFVTEPKSAEVLDMISHDLTLIGFSLVTRRESRRYLHNVVKMIAAATYVETSAYTVLYS